MSVANGHSGSVELSKYYPDYSNSLTETVLRYGGRPVVSGKHENLYAFNSSAKAVQCSLLLKERISKLNHTLREKRIRFETTAVLNAGKPVTSNPEFFGDTLQLARRLSHTGKDGDIIVSSCVDDLTPPSGTNRQNKEAIKITGAEDERFINRVMDVLERKMKNEKFNVVELCEHVGISRPHLYRRIQHLFGRSPNHLINEIRLKEAVKLLQRRFGNISEIAYEVGYSNPSYFSKCFQKRFGILPSGYNL
jgi:AraC-like DNA-binding protein